ncbi:MAG: cold shock domain-containing protein [Chloroflexota bacterium]|nr:cold shock domain-containing protein [Chloroflexota bacterium]
MTTGTITSLRDRGFGFVAPDGDDGQQDVFSHHSVVADGGFERLREGQRVSFDQEADPRDPTRQRAARVAPIAAEDQA